MSVGSCPSCRAPVEFALGGGKVKVCAYCNTVVVRGKVNLETLGKVADLVDTESPLKVGLSGKWKNKPFTVQGRLQKSRGDAVWDEWFLVFDDERTAWLTESEGEWRLLFPVPDFPPRGFPAFKSFVPLSGFGLGGNTFIVEEVGTAQTASAQGQLPDYAPTHPFVDATGPKGIFASVDFGGEQPEAFVGMPQSLADLGFDKSELSPTPRKEALAEARCTNCNGMLELKAPDAAKRVACPYCGALLDVRHGKLAFLQLLDKPAHPPVIPLGAKGTLEGATWVCIAFLMRSCTVEGTDYSWDEYLLYEKAKGFRWLMCANGHWTWLTPIPAGDVDLGPRLMKYGEKSFKLFQSVNTRTDAVQGECYWEVEEGERGFASEYVAPPESLNLDQSEGEATFTLGKLLEPQVVQKAFGLKQALPRATGIAPAQENPHSAAAKEGAVWAGIWCAALLGLYVVFSALAPRGVYLDTQVGLAPTAAPGSAEAQWFSEPFEIPADVPLEVELASQVNQSWLGVQVDLVNEATDEVISVYGEPAYYSGSDSDGSWSEGSRTATVTTEEVDKGRYVLRTTASWDRYSGGYQVVVRADSPSLGLPCFLMLLLVAWPSFRALRASSFETQRWNDSVIQSRLPPVKKFGKGSTP